MIQSEVIDKISRECCVELGDFDYFQIVRKHVQRALMVGTEHFTQNMEEIVALYKDGTEAGRFKGTTDASKKLGIDRKSIKEVLRGAHHSTGGLMFIRSKDYKLVPRKDLPVRQRLAKSLHL